jgi:hypothetical protein
MGAIASATRNTRAFLLAEPPRVTSRIVFSPSAMSCTMMPIKLPVWFRRFLLVVWGSVSRFGYLR